MTYQAAKHKLICATRKAMFELAVAQVAVGVGLLVLAYVIKSGEPPIVLWMSALALVFSGLTTAAVVAVEEGKT